MRKAAMSLALHHLCPQETTNRVRIIDKKPVSENSKVPTAKPVWDHGESLFRREDDDD
jgi:hypothetical protein